MAQELMRYLIKEGSDVVGSAKSLEEAKWLVRTFVEFGKQRGVVKNLSGVTHILQPNEGVAELLVSWGEYQFGERHFVIANGTREQLIKARLAAEYMFEALGRKITKSGSDEFGDKYELIRRKTGYTIRRQLFSEPQKPFGWGKRKPLDVMPRVLEIRDKGLTV